MGDKEHLEYQLKRLTNQHHDLSDQIEKLSLNPVYDQLAVQRLKRLKLQLKDEISKVKSGLLPDIIA